MTRPARTISPMRSAVLAMARRKVGVGTDEVAGLEPRQVGRVLEHLIKDGEVFRGVASRRVVRYYGHQADADAFVDAYRLEAAERRSAQWKKWGEAGASRLAGKKPLTARAPWADDAPPYYPHNEDGTPGWTHIVLPGPNLNPYRTNTHADLF